jgi:RimJ/RimL family protein N-acetyltransferase
MNDHWIPDNTELIGETVHLIPMTSHHLPELAALAKDKRIWEFYPFDGSDTETFVNTMTIVLQEKEQGMQFPFVILHRKTNQPIGGTRLMDIHRIHKKIEIGGTWLHPDHWATEINFECKLLLLAYCFETLGTIRVQLKTHENNIRSRTAIQKIGGKFEGILRKDMLGANGNSRNSAYFSIIDDEWPKVKPMLMELYEHKKQDQVKKGCN